MFEEQILPRLLARSGQQTAIYLKRFHSYGLGESHVDALLNGVEALVPDGSVKLGFRAHYPQLETKLTVRGANMADIRTKLEPVVQEVRQRLGNFILAEDEQTLEGVVLAQLTRASGDVGGGGIVYRRADCRAPGAFARAEAVFRRGTVARSLAEIATAVGLAAVQPDGELTPEVAETVARAARHQTGATHALAVLVDIEEGLIVST